MKIYLLLLLLFPSWAFALIVPYPKHIQMNGKGFLEKVWVDKAFHPLLVKKIGSIAEITPGKRGNLKIHLARPLNALPSFKMDEHYELQVSSEGIVIKAENEYGALHALETLRQFSFKHGGKLPYMTVKDGPRFPWRGLLIDVVRHWIGLDALKKQIDLMTASKMNVLHLHLSDDQGFRVESRAFPKLHEGNLDGKYFTQNEIKELVQYAGERGIRVVPEFDVPGHSTAIEAAYPALASVATALAPSINYGIHDSALNPVKEETYLFLEKLFGEMGLLFPDQFFHVGGDEVTGKHWLANPEIKKYMDDHRIKDIVELQFMFTKRMESLMKGLGKKMIAWDEVLKEGEELDSVAQIWRGPKYGRLALERKMPVLYSYGYYLDLQLSTETHYHVDPARDMELKKDPPLLWGGEAAMWSERVNELTISDRIWPRNLAIAERLWSPAKTRNLRDFYKRQSEFLANFKIGSDLAQKIEKKAKELNVSFETLQRLLSWMEPGKFYSQHRYRKFTTETPLDDIVESMPSESTKVNQFKLDLAHWLQHGNRASLNKVQAALREWTGISEALKDLKEPEYLLLAKDLKVLATMAEESLHYLAGKERPGHLWIQENRTRLRMTGHLRKGMFPGMQPELEKLVNLVRSRRTK